MNLNAPEFSAAIIEHPLNQLNRSKSRIGAFIVWRRKQVLHPQALAVSVDKRGWGNYETDIYDRAPALERVDSPSEANVSIQTYDVQNTSPKGPAKQLTLVDSAGRNIFFSVPRYACVGKGDKIAIDVEHPQHIFCVSAEDPNDLIKISPQFEVDGECTVGGVKFVYQMKEVSRQRDLDDLGFLEQFHYKSVVASSEEGVDELPFEWKPKIKTSGGRKAVLLLYIKLFGELQPAGYIELQMPLLMCKPRHELFKKPFSHSSRPISWESWDQHAMKKYVNTIVRIARIVTNPEMRGLGLARILIRHAQDYCRTRWQIAGRRPVFLEISAEMLNYIDFVSSLGFKYIGRTEGNLKRIVKDLAYMHKGYDVTSGIMSLQKKYVTALQAYSDETRKSFAEALDRLEQVLKYEDPAAHLSALEWAAFRKVLRPPIPYYLCGLDDDARAYLAAADVIDPPVRKPSFSVKGARLDLKSVSVRSVVSLPITRNVRIIMEAFGLQGEAFESLVVPSMPVQASAGNIILIAGASGSGKSALLRAIDPGAPVEASFQVRVEGARQYSCGWLRPLPLGVPIFDYFAERFTPERAFAALSHSGLSEAFVLVKPFEYLSRGQQYRAMMADLLLRDDQVWLLDEFCADLDPTTAKIVSHNFRRNVMTGSRIALVAAANHAHYIEALRPTKVIQMRTGALPRLTSYQDFRDGLLEQAS